MRGSSRFFLSVTWLLGLITPAACGVAPKDTETLRASERNTLQLEERSIPELQELMARGALTSVGLVRWYLHRIESLDRDGPELRAVLSVAPDAVAQAKQLDRERSEGHVRGPLHGVPLLIKDNIETSELPTTAGSLALRTNRTERDAQVVARLREAGVVILGKANLSEWANFRSTSSSSGWSALGGQTRNPYDQNYSPCGSSSGSAVAVSANLAAAALGTETDGSIVCPAAFSGVVGFKPSRQKLSSHGIIPISNLFDTAGPIARTSVDAALLYAVMSSASTVPTQDIEQKLRAASLRNKRFGVVHLESGADFEKLFEKRLSQMRQAGAQLVELGSITVKDHFEREFGMLIHHFRKDFNAYFRSLPNKPLPDPALEYVLEFNRLHRDEELQHFGQELFVDALAEARTTQHDVDGKQLIEELTEKFRSIFDEHDLHAMVMVTGPRPWRINWDTGDQFPEAPPASAFAAVGGFPHVSVPMGLDDGLPGGISFIGRRNNDLEVLALAHAFEKLGPHRVKPSFSESP